MLAGRAGDLQIASRSVTDGKVEFEASVPLIDPFNRVKGVSLKFKGTTTNAPGEPAAALADGTSVPMTLKDGRATCRFSVTPPSKAWALLVQTQTLHDGNQSLLSTPLVFGMGGSPVRTDSKNAATETKSPNASQEAPKVTPVVTGKKQLSASGAERVADSLKSGDAAEIRSILQTLRSFEPGDHGAEIADALEGLLSSGEAEIRCAAAEALGTWTRKETAGRLIKSAGDADSEVRHAVLQSLGKLKASDAAEAIAQRLANKDDRDAASRALIAIGPSAEKGVRKQLQASDSEARREVCRILGEIGTADSLEELQTLAKDSDKTLAESAAKAIRKIEQRGTK
jgi:hypothetical protein